jgi:hypothetical protein
MAPLTLAHVAKLEQDPMRKGIMMNLLRFGKLFELLPFEEVNSLTSVAIRWTNLPDVAFRRINEGYTTSTGDVDQVYESVYILGGDIEEDVIFEKPQLKSNYIVDPRQLQIDMKTKAMAFKFNDHFINGDHTVDEDGFEGLKVRVNELPARQKIRASATTDILDPTASAANARRFLSKWEEAFYKAGGGEGVPNVILCNEAMKWGLGQVIRYLGAAASTVVDMTKDLFDREFPTYKGVPLVDMGLKADQVTEVIPVSETAEDGGADATSVYFVPFNMEQGVHGIQVGPMEVRYPTGDSERETKPTKLIRVEWVVGLAGFGSYGPTRLHNIEDPAAWT